MPIVTEVQFGHPNGALADTLEALPELSVTVIQEASTDPERNRYLMRFDSAGAADVRSVLEADATVGHLEPMSGFRDQLWGVEFSPETKLVAPRVTSEDGFVLDARSTSLDGGLRGWHERWLLPDREALHDIWQYAREEGFEFDVLDFRQQGPTSLEYAGPEVPTDEQRETLVMAYERGYFAEPREVTLEELAEALEISPTAVAGRLRRGMNSLIAMTLAADRPEE